MCVCVYVCVSHRSLGAIMFEMMIGYPPFYSDDPLTTCRKIVNWRMFLKFPDEIQVRGTHTHTHTYTHTHRARSDVNRRCNFPDEIQAVAHTQTQTQAAQFYVDATRGSSRCNTEPPHKQQLHQMRRGDVVGTGCKGQAGTCTQLRA